MTVAVNLTTAPKILPAASTQKVIYGRPRDVLEHIDHSMRVLERDPKMRARALNLNR